MAMEISDAAEDKRIERLFDYTKWHIGIYLAFGGGLVGLLGSRDGSDFLSEVIQRPAFMVAALIAMAIAGAAGGVVVSATTRCNSFAELWPGKPNVYGFERFSTKTWASVEHAAFWVSIILVCVSILGWRPQSHLRAETQTTQPCCIQMPKCTK